jgi:hypothetical protein
MVILGISIGTRVTGIAIVNNTKLIAWQSHTFPAEWSKAKMDRIINRYEKYLRSHKVTMVIIKIPRLSHHNASIRNLLDKLRVLITFHGCMMDYTTLNEIKTKLPQLQDSYDIQDYTLNLYPVLLPEHARERVNKTPYHHKMFEAVLIAHLWRNQDR